MIGSKIMFKKTLNSVYDSDYQSGFDRGERQAAWHEGILAGRKKYQRSHRSFFAPIVSFLKSTSRKKSSYHSHRRNFR